MQRCYYRTTGEIYIGGIKSHKYNSNRCLVDPGGGSRRPRLDECKVAEQKRLHMLWDFRQVKASVGSKQQRVNPGRGFDGYCVSSQNGPIQNRETKRCLEIVLESDGYYHLVVGHCSDQTWKMQYLINATDGLVEKEGAPRLRRNGV